MRSCDFGPQVSTPFNLLSINCHCSIGTKTPVRDGSISYLPWAPTDKRRFSSSTTSVSPCRTIAERLPCYVHESSGTVSRGWRAIDFATRCTWLKMSILTLACRSQALLTLTKSAPCRMYIERSLQTISTLTPLRVPAVSNNVAPPPLREGGAIQRVYFEDPEDWARSGDDDEESSSGFAKRRESSALFRRAIASSECPNYTGSGSHQPAGHRPGSTSWLRVHI